MKDRELRVAELIKTIVSEILMEFDFFSKSLFTITSVSVQKDLKFAKIYYTVDNSEREETKNKLLFYKKKIKYLMGKKLNLKYVPEISFYFDESIEKFINVMEIFNKIENEKTDNK